MNRLAIFVAFLALVACGGDATDEESAAETAAANGLPTESTTINCGGDAAIVQGGSGTNNASGGDCTLGGEEEGDAFPDSGEPVPPFLGS